MKISRYFVICLTVLAMLIAGCSRPTEDLSSNKLSSNLNETCDELAEKLDERSANTTNPEKYIYPSGSETEFIGGILTSIDHTGTDRGYNAYILTFEGAEQQGRIYLLTSNNATLPYEVGKFYMFDLAEISEQSSALSGAFIDHDLDKLLLFECIEE